MPRVDRGAEVSLVVLCYKSLKWLQWCMKGTDESHNETRYRWHVVANDATEEVRDSPLIDIDFQNDNPKEYYLNRVYRAWNEGVMTAPTQLVIMLNSDMYGSDYWIDALMKVKKYNRHTVPTSLLVESGRIPSAMPEYVRNFGMSPESFKDDKFAFYASTIRKTYEIEPGRLFMPILVDRQEFMDVGGYPPGNPPGTTGDKDLIRRYAEIGYGHVTALGSVVYHTQEGEMRDA